MCLMHGNFASFTWYGGTFRRINQRNHGRLIEATCGECQAPKKSGIGIPDISVVTGMPPKGGGGFTIYFLAGQVF